MPYKIIKKPILGQPVKISKNFYEYKDRPEFRPRYERKSVPKCTIWMDKLPIWWDAEDEAKFEKYYPEEDDQDVSESESES